MSARERLLDVLNGNCNPLETRESLIDAYAHELAEKIRESTRDSLTRVTAAHGADWGRTWAQGREKAADLIDPECETP